MLRLRQSWVDGLPVVAAFGLLWALGQVWVSRITHPFDLEWMEGGMLTHSWRILEGLPLYPEPGPEFIPFIYPPGFSSLLAFVSQWWTLDYTAGRTLSIIGTLCAAAAIIYVIWKHEDSPSVGLMSAVIFLGCYPASGAFYDLVRPDGVAIGFLAWSLALTIDGGRRKIAFAGLLLCASFLMKHNMAIFGIPILLASWMRGGWRTALHFLLFSALPAGCIVLGMQFHTDGRFLQYLIEVPRVHPIVSERVMPGTIRELGTTLPIMMALGGWWFLTHMGGKIQRPLVGWSVGAATLCGVFFSWYSLQMDVPSGIPVTSDLYAAMGFWAIGASIAMGLLVFLFAIAQQFRDGWLQEHLSWEWVLGASFAVVALGMTLLMRGHSGGFLNVFIPMHWTLCLGGGIAISRLRQLTGSLWMGGATAVALLFQLSLLWQDLSPVSLVPSAADTEAGQNIIKALQDQEGPVLSPHASWLPVQAGHPPSFHLIALWDINHKDGPFYDGVGQIQQAVQDQYWGTIVDGTRPLRYGIQQHYTETSSFELPKGVFAPKTGWRVRPTRILTPQ
jgi:hypothetical protein